MSITCPKCGTEIDQDFGLVNCPSCSTLLAVDVDGNVQIPTEQPTGEGPATPEQAPVEAEFQEIDFAPTATSVAEPEAAPLSEFGEEESPLQNASKLLEEIKDFGNKDSSQGPLSYTLTIAGIDVASLRIAVLDALDEPKFGWTSKELSLQIQNGRLVLKDLSVAKTVMALRLLRGIKVEIFWQQGLYS